MSTKNLLFICECERHTTERWATFSRTSRRKAKHFSIQCEIHCQPLVRVVFGAKTDATGLLLLQQCRPLGPMQPQCSHPAGFDKTSPIFLINLVCRCGPHLNPHSTDTNMPIRSIVACIFLHCSSRNNRAVCVNAYPPPLLSDLSSPSITPINIHTQPAFSKIRTCPMLLRLPSTPLEDSAPPIFRQPGHFQTYPLQVPNYLVTYSGPPAFKTPIQSNVSCVSLT